MRKKNLRDRSEICITMRYVMAKSNIGVRFNAEQLADLKQIADANGVEVAQLIRWAVDALIRHVDRNHGRLILPLDFSETYEIIRREHPDQQLRAAEPKDEYKVKRKSA